jgi:hypothetical protein
MDEDVRMGFSLFNDVLDAIQGLLLTQHEQIQELTDRVTTLEGRTR